MVSSLLPPTTIWRDMFHNHHSHSYYSLLDGYSSPLELMKRASEIGMGALSITDHGTLSAHRETVRA